MRCPRCNRNTLQTVPSRRESAIRPKACSECGGIWVPHGEVEQVGNTEILYALMGGETTEDDVESCKCPNGHGTLCRAVLELDPPVRLDSCSTCRGVWFDRGEWKVLTVSHLVDHLEDLWNRSYQQKQRREQSERRYMRWARDQFGKELLSELSGLARILENHPHRADAIAFLTERSVSRKG